MYNSNFDYEKFSEDEDDNDLKQKKYKNQPKNIPKANSPAYKIPPPHQHLHYQKPEENFTINELKLIGSCRGIDKK